ncbi:MAG TPA: MMPL family transporter [Ktedonobacterales bacterium]|nr:MMPL family transporter [Ktedonobacterales bacterium]
MRVRERSDEGQTYDAIATSAVGGGPEREPRGLYRVGFAYGRVIYRLRWLVIALWILGVAASVPFAAQVSSVLTGGGFSFNGSDSVRAGNLVASALHQPQSQVIVVFQSANTAVTDPSFQNEVQGFIGHARDFGHVTDAQQGGVGADGRTTTVTLSLDQPAQDVEHRLGELRGIVDASTAGGPARAYVTGNPAVFATFNELTRTDTERAELAALPIALLVLLAVFGTLAAALLPLVLAAVAVPVALAVIYAIALHSETSVFVTNIASIVGLGISIDYSLLMTRRFREELAQGRTARDAVAWTIATAGEAILFSGLTVMIGFAGMMLIGIQFMTSFGIGGMVVVAAAVLAALTLLPALLGVLGQGVNRLRVPLLWRLTRAKSQAEEAARPGFWQRWALGVMRRPLLIVLVVAAILAGIGWPIFAINVGTTSAASLPKDTEARQGLEILDAQFPAANENPVIVVAHTADGASILDAGNVAKVDGLSAWVAGLDHVTGVTSITRLPAGQDGQGAQEPAQPGGSGQALTPDALAQLYASGQYQQVPALARLVAATTAGDTTVITVKTDAPIDSAAGKSLIDALRSGQAAHAGGLRVLVGGFQAVSLDFNRYLYDNFPRAILFILLATFVLLLIMFRSLLLPLKAVLMNALSVAAAYGVLVLVFQWGYLSAPLGFESTGFIDSIIPILLFCLLFGLSMDYEVFLLSRIREEWLRTRNNRYAVARGLEKTGGVITNAALLFVIVTGAFTFTRVIITKETGLGMTTAVLVDATIIRSLLVPATMRLLGRWNWWLPGRPVPVERQG